MEQLLIGLFLISFGYIVYYVINLLIKYRLTEAETVAVDEAFQSPTQPIDPNLNNRDAHYFLTTTLKPGKKAIVLLKESKANQSNYFYLTPEATKIELPDPLVVTHRPSKLSYPKLKSKLTCIPHNHPLREVIRHNQPYMWDQAEIINHYDHAFYRDWRYGEQPVDIRFAANPEKYCQMHPSAYPCPKYFSKW